MIMDYLPGDRCSAGVVFFFYNPIVNWLRVAMNLLPFFLFVGRDYESHHSSDITAVVFRAGSCQNSGVIHNNDTLRRGESEQRKLAGSKILISSTLGLAGLFRVHVN